MTDKYVGYSAVPYYSQKPEFLVREGSLNRSQISAWENSLCGLMCASMVLNQFSTDSTHTVAELLSAADKEGAFDQRRGWVHRKIVSLLEQYGIKGTSQKIDNLDTVYELLNNDNLIMASVSPQYLHPELKNEKKERSGHLVVIVGMNVSEMGNNQLVIHDPGSEVAEGGQNLLLDSNIFESSFSGNIIAFHKPSTTE